MNVLVDELPEAIEIGGKVCDICWGFKTGIDIMIMFEDPELTKFEKVLAMVHMLYKEIPDDISKAFEIGVKYLNCGEEEDGTSEGGVERLYSFTHDAKYIYSAIMQSHGIDLEKEKDLHWWKFTYLFLDLKENCIFNRLIYLRRQKNQGKLTKEETQLYNSLKGIVDLPMVYDSGEKEEIDEFMNLLNSGS